MSLNIHYIQSISVGNIVKSNYKGQEVELIAKDVHLVNSTQISDSNDSSFVEKCHKRDTEDEEESQNDSEKDIKVKSDMDPVSKVKLKKVELDFIWSFKSLAYQIPLYYFAI